MVEYITKDKLREIASKRSLSEQVTIAQESYAPELTFLYHSSKDADLLPGVAALLQQHGASVYIDKKDDSLPPYTSAETAEVLRGRIAESRKFILLTSENSKSSRWIPWELGLSDGYKGKSNIAIMPAPDSKNDTKWSEQEYLGVYNRIVFGKHKSFRDKIYMVWNHRNNTGTELSQWLL